jgi:hypothetical protein
MITEKAARCAHSMLTTAAERKGEKKSIGKMDSGEDIKMIPTMKFEMDYVAIRSKSLHRTDRPTSLMDKISSTTNIKTLKRS